MGKENRINHVIGSNGTEEIFASLVLKAGLYVSQSPSIRCDKPVKDKQGLRIKTVTTPDFLVKDPNDPTRVMFVEVTNGNGKWPSKKAQRRVVRAARVTNYVQLTGSQIETLTKEPDSEILKTRLFALFGW